MISSALRVSSRLAATLSVAALFVGSAFAADGSQPISATAESTSSEAPIAADHAVPAAPFSSEKHSTAHKARHAKHAHHAKKGKHSSHMAKAKGKHHARHSKRKHSTLAAKAPGTNRE